VSLSLFLSLRERKKRGWGQIKRKRGWKKNRGKQNTRVLPFGINAEIHTPHECCDQVHFSYYY
jgi:hypothetical protein